MNTLRSLAAAALAALALAGCRHQSPSLQLQLSDRYEGKTVELVSFTDSVPLVSAVVTGGRAVFGGDSLAGLGTVLAQVMIDGRVRAYYVTEPGQALITDSMSVASGTPLNDRFSALMTRLDSVEALDDMPLYLDFALRQYNENRDNPLGPWFGVEWMKYSELAQVDSLLQTADPEFAASRRVNHYRRFAGLRAATAPGHPYVDFGGQDAKGRGVSLSQFVTPGRYTLIDFWASWCPWCIKELPELKQLYADWHDRGLDIVGVAVRDQADDTAVAVSRHEIAWPVLYNAGRVPYDLYGFSGIPHHILVGPDGVIVSRGETPAQLAERLRPLLQ